jgi:hypothetical protein
MAWDDIAAFELRLSRALEDFDWPEARAVCDELVARIKREPAPLPERSARNLMYLLRRKRQFARMMELAEALLQSGVRTPQVRRQYAQALIDQDLLAAAEAILQSLLRDPAGLGGEELEARGLTGRVYKQLYVNRRDPRSPANRANLERALSEYLSGYNLDPQRNLWHGINVVALAARARRDGLPAAGLPDERSIAEGILAVLERREQESAEPPPWWDMATTLEAYVALGRHAEAVAVASKYIHSPGADAFEMASIIRQLTEVWQLSEEEAPGNLLLPICKAGYLEKQGAVIKGDSAQVSRGAAAAGSALETIDSGGFEKVFGTDMMVTLKWYKEGLAQCDSIARIEELDGTGFGTGWLVEASDFFPDRAGPLLLTNEHVISEDDMASPPASFPEDAQANFQSVGQVVRVGEIVWSSPRGELDATFVTLKEEPKARPLVLAERAMRMAEPPPRMYVIGHPKGRDLELSLQDNNLLACDERLLHYRTPTEPGNSGSPVFEPKGWRVVALHHKGHDKMRRLDGEPGTYEANECIAIHANQQRTRAHKNP